MTVLMSHIRNTECRVHRLESRRELYSDRRRNHRIRFGREPGWRLEPRRDRE